METWWKDAVIYQIYPRSFKDTTGNGIGDLKGIISKIDYIADLGVDAIWLSPIFTSPMQDMGYDVSNHRDIDPIFGNLKIFDQLIKKSHKNNIKVIIDQVLSHTSDQHPFFILSRSNKTNPKKDWYVWADAKSDGSPPNNWLSIFGGSAWEWDTSRKQYYLHNFLKSQPDLNFHNKMVQKWVLSTIKFWLEKGVDGFRLDTANYFFHDKKLRNNPALSNKKINSNPYYQQELKYSINQKENLIFMKALRKVTNRYKDIVMIGEIADPKVQAEYTSDNNKLHMAYSFELLRENFSNTLIQNTVLDFFKNSKNGWPCWSFSNHDVPRHVSRWSNSKIHEHNFAKLTCAILLSLKGTPCLYQGEELGQTQTEIEYDEIKDPPGKKFWPIDFGRDGCRTPMVWNKKEKNAGFSNCAPWLPIKKQQLKNAVEAQTNDKNSVLNFYKNFIAFRKKHAAFKEKLNFIKHKDLLIFSRGNKVKIVCIFNLNKYQVEVDNRFGYLAKDFPYSNVKINKEKIIIKRYGFGFFESSEIS